MIGELRRSLVGAIAGLGDISLFMLRLIADTPRAPDCPPELSVVCFGPASPSPAGGGSDRIERSEVRAGVG